MRCSDYPSFRELTMIGSHDKNGGTKITPLKRNADDINAQNGHLVVTDKYGATHVTDFCFFALGFHINSEAMTGLRERKR